MVCTRKEFKNNRSIKMVVYKFETVKEFKELKFEIGGRIGNANSAYYSFPSLLNKSNNIQNC